MKKTTMLISTGTLLLLSITNNVYAATPSWLNSEKVSCGNITNLPAKIPEIVSLFILVAQIIVPLILVLLGMIDFAKGVMSQKEDEIKKGQQTFIKRLIMGFLVFFVVALVKILVGVVGNGSENKKSIVSCIDCFINDNCETQTTESEENTTSAKRIPSPSGITSPELNAQ